MIAIIPARGGSKGLPGKNVMALAGKPLIAHTIEAALQARAIDRVIVSTDDDKIAETAKAWGAEVPFMRPANLASDDSKAIDAYLYTIERLEKEGGTPVHSVVILLPTSPLRTGADIDAAVALFDEKNADSVISYTPEAHPISWHRYLGPDGDFEPIFPTDLSNRQDIRTSYYPNGAIYVFRTQLLRERQYYGGRSFAYLMPRSRSVDIDSRDDFDYAAYLMTKR
jgi:N-acylneuraminate cytidylyltransferase/CMP-N,N'-diacetyllegionaminic acid synthase